MKRNYGVRVLERLYEVGDLVYILDRAVLKGKCRKLCAPWKGPGIVVSRISPSLYRLQLKNAVFVANHDRLKPCKDRILPAWIITFKSSPIPAILQDGALDNTLHCFCRKPWQNRFMIQCDEWYHGSCVNITASDALDIHKYNCSICQVARKK